MWNEGMWGAGERGIGLAPGTFSPKGDGPRKANRTCAQEF